MKARFTRGPSPTHSPRAIPQRREPHRRERLREGATGTRAPHGQPGGRLSSGPGRLREASLRTPLQGLPGTLRGPLDRLAAPALAAISVPVRSSACRGVQLAMQPFGSRRFPAIAGASPSAGFPSLLDLGPPFRPYLPGAGRLHVRRTDASTSRRNRRREMIGMAGRDRHKIRVHNPQPMLTRGVGRGAGLPHRCARSTCAPRTLARCASSAYVHAGQLRAAGICSELWLQRRVHRRSHPARLSGRLGRCLQHRPWTLSIEGEPYLRERSH